MDEREDDASPEEDRGSNGEARRDVQPAAWMGRAGAGIRCEHELATASRVAALPAGWPLFVEFRRWPMWTAFWASMVCLGVPIRWMLLKVDSHAVDVGLSFAAVYLLSFLIAQRFFMLRPRAVPPARWP